MAKSKFLVSIFTLCLGLTIGLAPLSASVAQADETKVYSYTITLFAGDGSFSNGATQKSTVVSNGNPVVIDFTDAVPNDDRYYAKGIRLAGHDNSEYAPSFSTATGDAQYVVAYGLKKNQVAYTLNFVDANGSQIAPSETLYGNPGDKPVVAFRYIDGYLPRAYNMTGTLSDNAAENVFTFTYDAAPGVTYEVIQVPGEAAVAAPGAVAAVVDAAAGGEIIGEDGNPLAAPQDVVDIDDEENPLSNFMSKDYECWVHRLMFIGMLITLIYGVGAVLRRRVDIKELDKTQNGPKDQDKRGVPATNLQTHGI